MRLFDTMFLIDLVNSHPGAVELAAQVDDEESPAAISVISAHEYLFGVHYRYGGTESLNQKLAEAKDELSRFEVLPLTSEVIETSSKVGAELAKSGRQIGINDVYIAATAIRYSFTLVTRNEGHFARIAGLALESY